MSKKDVLKRIRRAKEERGRYEITPLGKGLWIVRKFKPNSTRVERTYYVSTRSSICSCKDFRINHSPCKHIIMCVFQGCRMIAEVKKVKALTQA